MLNQKLKMIKTGLRERHIAHCQNLEGKISDAEGEINRLEIKGESFGLTIQLQKLSKLNYSNQWQKSKVRWLWEGMPTQYFH